jgi:hypothetical protein
MKAFMAVATSGSEIEFREAGVGSRARVRDAWGEEEHTLVAPTQSDPAGGRISIESPAGSGDAGPRGRMVQGVSRTLCVQRALMPAHQFASAGESAGQRRYGLL